MTNNKDDIKNSSAMNNSKNILGADHDNLVNYPTAREEVDNIERFISAKNRILWTISAFLDLLLCIAGESGVNFIGDNQSKKEKKKRASRGKKNNK